MNHYLGRRGEIFITSLILIATPIASGFTHSWEALFAVRLVLGIGMGAKAATVPMYAAEREYSSSYRLHLQVRETAVGGT